MNSKIIFNGKISSTYTVALAHGAGASMNSDFMNYFSEGLADNGFRVARFNFSYMQKIIKEGKRRLPNSEKILLSEWKKFIAALGTKNLIIGVCNAIISLLSFISRGTVNLLNLIYNFKSQDKKGNKIVTYSLSLSFLVLVVIAGIIV